MTEYVHERSKVFGMTVSKRNQEKIRDLIQENERGREAEKEGVEGRFQRQQGTLQPT
jgi:hypothetical protein